MACYWPCGCRVMEDYSVRAMPGCAAHVKDMASTMTTDEANQWRDAELLGGWKHADSNKQSADE